MNPTQVISPVVYDATNGKGYGYNGYNSECVDGINGNQVANLRHDVSQSEAQIRRDVCKAESDIRSDIGHAECNIVGKIKDVECNVVGAVKDAECRLNTNMLSQFGMVREQLIRNEYEAKLGAEKVIKEVNTNAQHVAERAQDRVARGFEDAHKDIDSFRGFVAEKFCDARKEGLEDKIFKLSQALQTQQIIQKVCCEDCGSSSPGNSGNN